MTASIFKYGFFLLLALFAHFWIFYYSSWNLPEVIPGTPIKISGLLLVGVILTILILAEKNFLKKHPDQTIFNLTILGSAICFFAEFIFQSFRQAFIMADTFSDRLYFFLLGTIGISIFGAAFSFLIAFQLKTKRTGQLVLLIIGLCVIVNIVKYLFPNLQS